MSIAILATGDELVHGDTLNTNSHHIAHTLCSESLPLGLHLTCGDSQEAIVSCLDFLCKNHNIIILTGGLGPTSDDRTRFALADYLKIKLHSIQEALTHVETRLAFANLKMTPGNCQQALFPTNATLLPNPYGTAMGCYFSKMNKLFILLPGPPRECLPMFDNYVLPILKQTTHGNKQTLKWRLFGVAEGEIAQKLDSALNHIKCETGYRLETPYLEFKVHCQNDLIHVIKQIIEPLVSRYIIASPGQKASERLCNEIENLSAPIVIIDDATGGKLQTLIQRPSNCHNVNFHENKKNCLQFHLSGLQEYWSQKPPSKTNLTIKYSSGQKQHSETHQIPYYSPTVVDYAAEWLSFRLLALIEEAL